MVDEKVLKNVENQKLIAKVIEEIFYEKKNCAYCGGSLCFKVKEISDSLIDIAPKQEGFSDEINFWVCMCYIKYKGPQYSYYKYSVDFVNKNKHIYMNDNEFAKTLLII